MPVKKDILYPIFLECFDFISDTFWENIFEDLAYGKTPYGTYISKGFLCCNYKNKEFSYKIEKKDPEQLYNDVYLLLAKKVGIQSHRDKIKKKIDFENIEDEIKEYKKNWNKIRKKNIKDLLIEKYVINMKNKYHLDYKQAQNLQAMIFIGMIFKVITCKDIDYSDGIIKNINGISFKKKSIIVERDIYDNNDLRKCILIEKNLMSTNWEKYLTNLRKLIKES